MINNRMDEIRKKGFTISNGTANSEETYAPVDFSKIKVGLQHLEDATLSDVSVYSRISTDFGNKERILRAIANNDLPTMQAVSNFFYRTSGIYGRLCKYLAYMYRYD